MRREDRFVMSHRPYAVDLGSLHAGHVGTQSPTKATAVWFRRPRRGVTMACVGLLWDYQDPLPATVSEFLERHDDGRYGGETLGRWDGERYWGAQRPELIEEHLALLRPTLENFPAVPAGFDGWWTFRR
jgi:hypothetical protein